MPASLIRDYGTTAFPYELNGIAFDNAGQLYLQSAAGTGQVTTINPNTGVILAGPTAYSAVPHADHFVDLAACSLNPTLSVAKNVVSRFAPADQFNLSITGGGVISNNTATTSGTATGVQSAVAGPVVGVTGDNYTITETAASGSLANYTTSHQCIDNATGTPVTVGSGGGTTFVLTFPSAQAGATGPFVTCTFTNTAIVAPTLVVTKSVTPASTTPVVQGQALTYTLTFANTAGTVAAPVDSTDDLTKVLDDATVTTNPALATGTGLSVTAITGGTFRVTGSVAAGASATVTYAVTVNTPDTGDHDLLNFVVPTGTTPPATCVAGNPACTENPVPDLIVTKSVTPASTTTVTPGQVLTYTLTFANTAGKAAAPVDSTDDLTKVIDDATVTTNPGLATGTGLTVGAITSGTFRVTGSVAAGAKATVTYAVTVNTPDTGDHDLLNFVVPTGTTPPATCVAGNRACTENPVSDLVVSKSVTPASTTRVNPGQVLTYTLTFDNTAGKAAAVVNWTDNLSQVLDDATVTVNPMLATVSGLVLGPITSGAFMVSGSVSAATSATITYVVQVNNPDTGDHNLVNFLVPTGTTPPATCVAGNPDCTNNPVNPPGPPIAYTGIDYPLSNTVGVAGLMLLIGAGLLILSARRRRAFN